MSAAEPAAAATRPDRSPGVIPGDRSPASVDLSGRSVALVHEWIAERAGGEKVFERLAALFPSADLFALSTTPEVRIETTGRPIRTTALDQHFFRTRRALSLPLMPIAWRLLRRDVDHDIVITSAHAFAREVVRPRSLTTHLCYVHSPMRYAWERNTDPRTSKRRGTAVPAAVLRTWDRRSVRTVDSFAVNSRETQDRVHRHYGRDSVVIHPPVDIAFFRQAHRNPAGYLFAFGRFIDYKRFDVAIAVAERAGRPLVMAGSGPREDELRAMAKRASVPVRIVKRPSDDELLGLLGGAEVLLFPGVEDFGLVPVEAQAAGVPVVGPALGGLRDTVDHLTTGVLVDEPTVDALAAGVEVAVASHLGGEACRTWAERFSPDRFDREMREWVTGAT